MTVDLDLIVESAELETALGAVAKGLTAELAELALQGAQLLTGEIRAVLYDTSKDGRTGNLARSFRERFIGSADGVIGAGTFSDSVYARIQDEGGEVLPHGKNLAIPLPDGGVPFGMWPRQWAFGSDKLFKVRIGRTDYLATRGPRLILRYVLKPSVTLPARHYLRAAAERAAPGLVDLFGDRLVVVIRAAGLAVTKT